MNIDKKILYRYKMKRVAEEPIAFYLYKKRHFENFKRDSQAKVDPDDAFSNADDIAKQFRKELLKMANA